MSADRCHSVCFCSPWSRPFSPSARDCRTRVTGRPPYYPTILTSPNDRRALLREGWKAVAQIFVLAVIMDAVYQLLVFRWVYPGELLLVAFLLACVPYLLIRGPVNRIARRRPSTHSPV